MINNKEYKYVMIVTAEDERYESGEKDLSWFGEHPWEGYLVEIVFGNSFDELMDDGSNEGLFQQTYEMTTGKRLSYGFLDPDTPREEIEEFEKRNRKCWTCVVFDVAEKLGWDVVFFNDHTTSKKHFTFKRIITAEQEFNFEVEAVNFTELYSNIDAYFINFDVSKETYLRLDNEGHGVNGAPYDMIDVYSDMKMCEDQIEKLKNVLEEVLDDYKNKEES